MRNRGRKQEILQRMGMLKNYILILILGDESQEQAKCFPGDSIIFDWEFNKIQIKDLVIGDQILSAQPSGEIIYDTVIGFLHYKPNDYSTYLLLSTNKTQLSITQKHILLTNKDQLKSTFLAQKSLDDQEILYEFAKNIKIGQKVMIIDPEIKTASWQDIFAIEYQKKQGIYAPLTNSGTLIVDGTVVSCFANFKHQQIADLMFYPFKLLYKYFPNNSLLENNQDTGLLELFY